MFVRHPVEDYFVIDAVWMVLQPLSAPPAIQIERDEPRGNSFNSGNPGTSPSDRSPSTKDLFGQSNQLNKNSNASYKTYEERLKKYKELRSKIFSIDELSTLTGTNKSNNREKKDRFIEV